MFPLLLQSIISNQMRPRRLRVPSWFNHGSTTLMSIWLFVLGVDMSEGRASNPSLDLIYVRNKLSGSGPVVQLLSAVAISSTKVMYSSNIILI